MQWGSKGPVTASSLSRLGHGPGKQCPCTDKGPSLAGLSLFYGNLLFIELPLEQYNQSWYIGAIVGVTVYHDAEQGLSPYTVKNKGIIFFVP